MKPYVAVLTTEHKKPQRYGRIVNVEEAEFDDLESLRLKSFPQSSPEADIEYYRLDGMAAGIPYEEALRGPNGSSFLLIVPPDKKGAVNNAVSYLRNTFDVVEVPKIFLKEALD